MRKAPWFLVDAYQERKAAQKRKPRRSKAEPVSYELRYRMIDWLKAGQLLIGGSVVTFFGLLLSGVIFHSETFSWLLLLASIVAVPLTVIFELLGYVFDTSNDSLTYPRGLVRRTIPISGMRNANCQTTSKSRTYTPGRLIGDNNPTRVTTKTYAVNLSGSFGVRRVTFAAKYKRDQFLDMLSTAAPDCHITRWT
jgi:hypothetical protein